MVANICTMPIKLTTMPKAGAIADRALDLLALVQMGEEESLEIVADEIGVIAVGDEADAVDPRRK